MWFIGTGIVISVIGWAFLLWGVAVEANSSLFARPDVAAHKLAIITSFIYLGYALSIFGAVWELPKRVFRRPQDDLEDVISQPSQQPVRQDPVRQDPVRQESVKQNAKPETAKPKTNDRGHAPQPADWSHVEAEFKKTFGVVTRIDPYGRVALLKGNGRLDFENVNSAWDYCIQHLYKPGETPRP